MVKKEKFNKNYPTAVSVFNKWAEKGKDVGMENGHQESVNYMFDQIKPYLRKPFSALDIGCGNGWVVRKFNKFKNCKSAIGVDGAKKMIEKAKAVDAKNKYICADLLTWIPTQKFDIIHSMEVLYYLEEPDRLLKKIYTKYLNENGCFIFGIDHYLENKPSNCWPVDVGVNMNTKPILFWIDEMKIAGFKNIKYFQFGAKDDWLGTLVIYGEK